MKGRTYEILANVESKAFWGAVLLTFLSFQLGNSLLYLLLLWSGGSGILVAYILLRVLPRLPNLLLHKPRPLHLRETKLTHEPDEAFRVECPVCNEPQCVRHRKGMKRDYLHPWDHLLIPSTIDNTLSGFLEIVFQRFVYSWHRQFNPTAESFEDELRVSIRFAAANLLRRAQMIDIPHLITHKLLQAVTAHIHIYTKARRRLPPDATVTLIEAAVIKEYGNHLHTAMRGPTGNMRYFRHLTQALMPLLLPKSALHSSIMCSFIQELFTVKIFVPAMNFTANPDFLNKIILIIFNKNSRLEKTFGPESKRVLFLAKFANRRESDVPRPLELPLMKLLSEQDKLYTFMQFMKNRDALHVLQVYLSLNDLKDKVNTCTESNSAEVLSAVQTLHGSHFLPSSFYYLPLDTDLVRDLTNVLYDTSATALEKCLQLRAMNIFGRIRGYIYHELLSKIYCLEFTRDHQFFELHISGQNTAAESKNNSARKGDKWRQKTTQFSLKLRLKSPVTEQTDSDNGPSQDSIQSNDTKPPSPIPVSLSVPIKVKVIDENTYDEGLIPYTVFTVLTTRKDENKTSNRVVKRRFKEFVCLDSKLRQFHGQMCPSLPSKKAFKTLDKSFLQTRIIELDQYLEALITTPGIMDGQVLASFLSDSSDPMLFMPDTVGDKAGKMIKSVPNLLKREKGPYMEELLQSLSHIVMPPPSPPSSPLIRDVTMVGGAYRDNGTKYVQQACEDASDSKGIQNKPWLEAPSLGESLNINSIMDLLVFVAVNVYDVSPFQTTVLMLLHLLGQESIKALTYNFAAERVELMESETKIVQLIQLLKNSLFFNKDPPRTEADIRERCHAALNQLLTYPHPLLVQAIGETIYRSGTELIFEGLQCKELNKQLFFQLLDIIILELFPELGE